MRIVSDSVPASRRNRRSNGSRTSRTGRLSQLAVVTGCLYFIGASCLSAQGTIMDFWGGFTFNTRDCDGANCTDKVYSEGVSPVLQVFVATADYAPGCDASGCNGSEYTGPCTFSGQVTIDGGASADAADFTSLTIPWSIEMVGDEAKSLPGSVGRFVDVSSGTQIIADQTTEGVETATKIFQFSGTSSCWLDSTGYEVIINFSPLTNDSTYNLNWESVPFSIADTSQAIPEVGFAKSSVSVDEAIGTANLEVSLFQPAGPGGAQVSCRTVASGSTATEGEDYRAVDDLVLQWNEGESGIRNCSVSIIDDDVDESDKPGRAPGEVEIIAVELFNPQNATLDPEADTATITIVDDDGPPELAFTSASYTVDESAGQITIGVVPDKAVDSPDRTLEVSYATTAGTATAGADFQPVSGTLSWDVNDVGIRTFTVPILQDGLFEGDVPETIQLRLSSPVYGQLGSPSTATIEIVDDDSLGGISLVAESFQVSESAGTAEIGVKLMGSTGPEGASILYEATAGTAQEGQDFRRVSGSLTWPAGASGGERTFTVPIIDDSIADGDKTVSLTLSDPRGAQLVEPSSGELVITDNETLGKVSFQSSEVSVDEDVGTVTVQVELVGSTPGRGSVVYEVIAPNIPEGAATPGEDFVETSGTLVWENGSPKSQSIRIEILDDNVLESTETVRLLLRDAEGIGLGERMDAALRIRDNDSPSDVSIEEGDEQAAGVNSEMEDPLMIQVLNEDGDPVEGAVVEWEVLEGEATLLDGSETVTNEEGMASNRVRTGSQIGALRIRASVVGSSQTAVFSLQVRVLLADLPVREDSRGIVEVLDDICGSDNQGDLEATCDALAELPPEQQIRAIEELTPRKVASQGVQSLQSMTTQLRNIGSRLAALRRSKQHSLELLAFNVQGERIPGTVLASLLHDDSRNETEMFDMEALLTAQLRGGAASADPQETEGEPVEGTEGKRLGFFLAGLIASGERPTTLRETGFDFETDGLTLGLDYRFTDRLVFGGALGYMKTDTELAGSGGSMDAEGISFSAYSLYLLSDQLFLEGVLSYGENDFESRRVIDFPGNPQVAVADPKGDQIALALGLGYDLSKGASTINLSGRGSYLDASIDRYKEEGAPGMELEIRDQSIESLLSILGLQYSYAGSMSWGILSPELRLDYKHEFENSSRIITASFVGDPRGLTFGVPTDSPDRDYFTGGLGLSALFRKGVSAWVVYEQDFSRSDLDVWLLTAGLRLELR